LQASILSDVAAFEKNDYAIRRPGDGKWQRRIDLTSWWGVRRSVKNVVDHRLLPPLM
jgi:hypothetical protein